MSESLTLKEKMTNEITSKLESAFETVIDAKNKEYQENPHKIPTVSDINSLISSVSFKNSAISGGANLVPGPWGMLAVVPELILVIKNQIGLVYDIAAAYGQRNVMTKELAAIVFVSGLGTSAGSLLTVHGGKYLVKRASLRVFQQIIAIMGGKITQQALKSTISKWLPGIGAAAMAAWTNYMTRQIGKKAVEIFSKGIVVEDGLDDISIIDSSAESIITNSYFNSLYFIRLKILTNLARIDGKLHDNEFEFITDLIKNSEISESEKTAIIERLTSKDNDITGIDQIAKSPDDIVGLISDMIALANRDNNLHPSEKIYIKQIAKMLGVSEEDIHELLNDAEKN